MANQSNTKAFLYVLIGFVILLQNSNAQQMNLNSFKWKNRLLIIKYSEQNTSMLREQLDLLRNKSKELSERKLLLIELNEKGYQMVDKKVEFVKDSLAFKSFNLPNHKFHVLLIGLDGGIKYETTSPISPDELFSIIDKMPMRRSELKNKH